MRVSMTRTPTHSAGLAMSLLNACLVAACVLIVGCGSGAASGPDGGGSGGTTDGSGGAGGLGGGAGGGGSAGSSGAGGVGGARDSFELIIDDMAFSPVPLIVPAGARITVRNRDRTPHSVISTKHPGVFDHGSVDGIGFHTGRLAPNSSEAIVIPLSAKSGTVVYYYCGVETNRMANSSENRIEIE